MRRRLLNVDKIKVFYGKVQALFEVSLKVEKSELVGLIGANGAGKTTTLKTISGLLHPEEGSIYFMGKKIDHLPPHKIVELGISLVPEGRHLFPNLTVVENLKLGASTREARAKVHDTMEWVFNLFPILKERKNQRAQTLSGGEQQMLAIARGLMSRPRLLLLDEPSTGLAPILASSLFKTIKELNEEGVTILLVEQNVKQALRISDRAYVLETGKIVLEGRSDELLNDPRVKKAYLGIT